MSNQRTGGMTAIGILNIVFGSVRGLLALFTILGGGLVAALGSAAGEEAGTSVAAQGGAIAVIGLVALVCSIMLLIAGIGVLKMKPWGRSLSLAAAALWLITSIGQVFMLEFSVTAVLGMVYPAIVVGLFMTPAWRHAFSGLPTVDIPADDAAATQPEEMRPAA